MLTVVPRTNICDHPSKGFSGYIWLDTKIVVKNIKNENKISNITPSSSVCLIEVRNTIDYVEPFFLIML